MKEPPLLMEVVSVFETELKSSVLTLTLRLADAEWNVWWWWSSTSPGHAAAAAASSAASATSQLLSA